LQSANLRDALASCRVPDFVGGHLEITITFSTEIGQLVPFDIVIPEIIWGMMGFPHFPQHSFKNASELLARMMDCCGISRRDS